MNFPRSLRKNISKTYDARFFLPWQSVYIRHKPGDGWDIQNSLPDYSRIKIDKRQSCNWSIFSIPVWARFDDNVEYKRNYAVIRYSIKDISARYNLVSDIAESLIYVVHQPLDSNCSHCELVLLRKLTPSERRQLRILITQNCTVCLIPEAEPTQFQMICQRLNMILCRWRTFLLKL